jgi:cyclopropane fatty-acyl-phospholipid synthase-like methyltransferase
MRFAHPCGRDDRILDYGCGKGDLVRELAELGYSTAGYDPAVPEYQDEPEGVFEYIVCTDVLEHVEPEHLDDVFRHMRRLLAPNGAIFFSIGLVPAVKTLPDGSNAHKIIKTADEWASAIAEGLGMVVFSVDSRRTTAEMTAYGYTEGS